MKPQRTQRFYAKDAKKKLCDLSAFFVNSAVKRTIAKPQRTQRFYAKDAKKKLCDLSASFVNSAVEK